MKNKFILLSLLALSAASAAAINPQYQKFLGLKYRDNCANFEPGNFQSISGVFNGKTRDTLTLFPFDGFRDVDIFYYDQWILISKNGTVPSKVIESYWPVIMCEGDLDGNGCDEVGYISNWMIGCWSSYKTLTYYRKKWEPFLSVTYYTCDERMDDILRPGPGKGKVRVREHVWGDDGISVKNYTKSVTRFLR